LSGEFDWEFVKIRRSRIVLKIAQPFMAG